MSRLIERSIIQEEFSDRRTFKSILPISLQPRFENREQCLFCLWFKSISQIDFHHFTYSKGVHL
ncbi:unnamed protein product [Haemonchus placei]|uniref:Uncharacterized protein n=1 Tax=Haemonchus placei TaxID=6290 RepID=A0A0N4WSR4_HAEPC|nr:unnamed protein product [Haemonchus placei]